MCQSLTLVLVHIVFSTKNRSPFLQSAEVRSQVHTYLSGTLRALECAPLQVGGVEDHVHILCGLSRKISLAELVKNLKTSSTKVLKGKVTTVSADKAAMVLFLLANPPGNRFFPYIAEQEIHHRRLNFQDEFRALLNKHGIRFDERYVWD
jgi:putative transposase